MYSCSTATPGLIHTHASFRSTVFVQRKWQMCDRHRCSRRSRSLLRARLAPFSSQAPREQASEQLLQQNPSRLSSMDEEEEESKGQPAERPVATAMYLVPSAVRFASVRQFAKEQVDRERGLIVLMTKERIKTVQSSSSLQGISIRLDLN